MSRAHPCVAIALLGLLVLSTGCATRFSPELIRQEIVTQQGADPRSAFELTLGRFTTHLIKTAMAGEDGELPFAGLGSLELAVYEAPTPDGPVIDVTRIPVVGWEPVLRLTDPGRSGMVLIQPRGERIGDLVLVGAGTERVVYARLTGTLDPGLPSALGDVLRDGGPEEVQRVLTQLGE
ncbi:MAG: hypothetical protein AAGC60_04660 [Acidobacteriota bacterium]